MIHGFIHSEIDGRMPTESECGGFILFMFLAGIDTMGATTAWLLRHLALHPELRRNLIAHPERRGAFLEEGFRRYAVVSTNRFVKRDVEMCGVLLKQGDNVLVSAPFANMDALRFDSPEQFDPDRRGRHLTFVPVRISASALNWHGCSYLSCWIGGWNASPTSRSRQGRSRQPISAMSWR
jgi:cytochrome P450